MDTQTMDRSKVDLSSTIERVKLHPFSEILSRDETKVQACPNCSGITFWTPGVRFLLTSNLGLNPRFDAFGHNHPVIVCTNPECQAPLANIDGTYYDVSPYLTPAKVKEILAVRFAHAT